MTGTNQPLTIPQAVQVGLEHFQAGRLSEAEAIFRQILAVDPDNAAALQLLGCIAHETGRHDQAFAFFSQAIQGNPADPFLHFNLGVSLEEQGKAHEAMVCYRKALELNPNYAEAYNNMGTVLHAQGKPSDAVSYYHKALALSPNDARAHNNLGMALQQIGKLDESLACYRKALEINPNYAEAHNNLGSVFHELGKATEALTCYREALALSPNYAQAHNNLGVVLQKLGNVEEALSCYRRALELKPDYADAYNNLGSAFQDLAKPAEAVTSYRKALQLKPDYPGAQWNLSTALLLCGDLAKGLALYEKRFDGAAKSEVAVSRKMLETLSAKARWQGDKLQGRTLLIWTEQGLGDSLMMLRYLPLLEEKGAGKLYVACPSGLARIFRNMPCVDQVISDGLPALESFDCHCPMMSLPYLFDTRLETIPNTVPYITVPPDMMGKWASRLKSMMGLKVGLSWAGSRTQRKDALRSISPQRLAPLLATPGVQFISLQKGESCESVTNWMAECGDFLDTAALMQQLDLIISVDTSVAHLAGALGKPVWLLNRFESEWRWLMDREDSPWYPTMRIFRQPALYDWDSVIKRVAEALVHLAATHADK